MKNVITKFGSYKDNGFFNHIYFVDTDYNFNEKSIEEIVKFIVKDPFHDIMIHANDLNVDVIDTIKCVSKIKDIIFQTDTILFEDISIMDENTLNTLGMDKVDIMIDALGDMIDLKNSLKRQKFIKYHYNNLPF